MHVTQTRPSEHCRFVTPVIQSFMRPQRATMASAAATEEKFAYKAETDRLMDMIVNSLYSNKEVFLRELVSNASDALDKVRITSLTDPDVLKSGTELEVLIKVFAQPARRHSAAACPTIASALATDDAVLALYHCPLRCAVASAATFQPVPVPRWPCA